MANNYCISSSKLVLEPNEALLAQAIIDRVEQELTKEEEGYCGVNALLEDDGVWFYADENVNTEHMERIARALIEELEIDEPFFASWAYTCSKPRIDEFGGGAFVIMRGYETYWVDAMNHVRQIAKRGQLKRSK